MAERTKALSAHVGNAPTLMSLKHLKQIAPTWMNTSKAIFDDKEAHEVMPAHASVSMCSARKCARLAGQAYQFSACLKRHALHSNLC